MGGGATSVLFVCLGNICRSPMAHGMLRARVAALGRAASFVVDSCGTAAYHVGADMDPGTARVLRERDAWYRHVARQLTQADLTRFDHVLVMDRSNLATIQQRHPRHGGRARLVTEPVGGQDVPDPWGGGPADFRRVWDVLEPALEAWLHAWHAQNTR